MSVRDRRGIRHITNSVCGGSLRCDDMRELHSSMEGLYDLMDEIC